MARSCQPAEERQRVHVDRHGAIAVAAVHPESDADEAVLLELEPVLRDGGDDDSSDGPSGGALLVRAGALLALERDATCRATGSAPRWRPGWCYARAMTDAATRHALTYDEYVALERASEGKHEFAEGELFAMSGGTRAHNRLSVRFLALLETALGERPCLVFGSDQRVRTGDDVATYPDLSGLCERPVFTDATEDELRNPALLVEVLSPSTEAYDRGEKFAHCRTLASLREYVLASSSRAQVEVFSREADGWKLRTYGPGTSLTLESLGVELAVDELYRKVFSPSDTARA